jgi:hypothetical protein
MEKSYKQFVEKLNAYIRKFYFYQLIRGLLLFLVLFVCYYILISFLEYINYFNPGFKLVIILFTVFFTLLIFHYFVFLPLIKLFGIGKRVTYADISARLSLAFPDIADKLINIVELHNESNLNYSSDLVQASIEQKISELRIYQFSDSIRFKDLRKIALLFLGVILVVVATFIEFPDFYRQTSVRLIHYTQKFDKPAPYFFKLENPKLEFISGESVELKLHCIGKNLPEMMYINIGGNNFLMNRKGDFYYYTIDNLNSSISIFFTDKVYISDFYNISVINKPFISSFELVIQPPAYTNLPIEKLQSIGDVKIVSGSTLKWLFRTSDTDSLYLSFSDSSKVIANQSIQYFNVQKTIYSDLGYKVFVKNSKIKEGGSLFYKIKVINDLYPEIKVVQLTDSLDFKVRHFKGSIIDDFGFNKLEFHISTEGIDSSFVVPFVPFMLSQDFYYSFNFESVSGIGKSFKYYFTVYDNDLVKGFKKAVSETFTFNFPDYKEIAERENSDQDKIESLIKKSNELADDIKQQLKNFKLKQLNSDVTDWNKYQSVKDIVSKKNELQNVLDQIKQQNSDANNFLKSFTEDKSDVLKKQQQVDDLLKEVMNDDLKKLFEEFNELAKQFDSKKFEQLSKNMDSRLDDLSKQLDKNLQLLKKMKVQQKIERIIDNLGRLATAEKENLKSIDSRNDLLKVKNSEAENKSLIEDLNNDYNSSLQLNKELERPMNLANFDREFSEISGVYSKILENIDKSNKRKTQAEIQSATQKIEELSFAIQQMLNSITMKQNAESIETLKQILNNLLVVSFDQENLLKRYSNVDTNNPLVNEWRMKQKVIGNQVTFVKDSLYSLARRSPDIGPTVNKEIIDLESNTNSAFESLEAGNASVARMFEQYSITSANNLALFLSEALENIREQEKNSQPGSGDCEKPGGKSKPSMKSLKDSQMSIKQQLQKMIDEMKAGNKGQLSKSIGQTIAQQEIMQQLIKEMINGGSVGSKTEKELKLIDQMLEQTKGELINRNITNDLLNRQNLILSKLLDAEKAEIEREFDDKRESKTGTDQTKVNPKTYFEFGNKSTNESEFLKRDNFKMKIFYDQKYNSYLNRLKN